MNLLECYIKEIEIIEKLKYEENEYYKIKVTTNCHGNVQTRETIVSSKYYDTSVNRGYFLW